VDRLELIVRQGQFHERIEAVLGTVAEPRPPTRTDAFHAALADEQRRVVTCSLEDRYANA